MYVREIQDEVMDHFELLQSIKKKSSGIHLSCIAFIPKFNESLSERSLLVKYDFLKYKNASHTMTPPTLISCVSGGIINRGTSF